MSTCSKPLWRIIVKACIFSALCRVVEGGGCPICNEWNGFPTEEWKGKHPEKMTQGGGSNENFHLIYVIFRYKATNVHKYKGL